MRLHGQSLYSGAVGFRELLQRGNHRYRLDWQAKRAAIIAAVGVALVLAAISTAVAPLVNPERPAFSLGEFLAMTAVALFIALLGLGGMASYVDRATNPRAVTGLFAWTLIVFGVLIIGINAYALIAIDYRDAYVSIPLGCSYLAIGALTLCKRAPKQDR